MSARDRSPRPVEILPVTLCPNPVLMAAPRPDRMTSLLVACTVYCALGAAVLGGTRHLVTHPPVLTGPTVCFDPPPEPVLPELKLPPPPSGGGTRPEGFKAIEPPVNSNVVPIETPNLLPKVDHSGELAVSPGTPVGPRVEGLTVNPGPSSVVPAHAAAPVNIEFQQVKILSQTSPVYPALAKMIHVQGPVELRMTINTAGVPTEVEVISGPHPLLINEAVRVARLWRFQPAMVDGAAVAATFRLTVGFRLER